MKIFQALTYALEAMIIGASLSKPHIDDTSEIFILCMVHTFAHQNFVSQMWNVHALLAGILSTKFILLKRLLHVVIDLLG